MSRLRKIAIYLKITQKFINDVKLLLGAFENAPTSKQIRTTFLDVESPKPPPSYLRDYQLNEPNLIIVASKKGGQKTLFDIIFIIPRTHTTILNFCFEVMPPQEKLFGNPGFYTNWKESYNGVLEPTNFRGEESIVRIHTSDCRKKKVQITLHILQQVTEKSPFDLDANYGYSEFVRILSRIEILKFHQST